MQLFGLFEWPRLGFVMNLPAETREHMHTLFGEAHELIAKLVYLLVALHVAWHICDGEVGCLSAKAAHKALFGIAILRNFQRLGRRIDGDKACNRFKRCNRHIFKFEGHDIALLRKIFQRGMVVIRADAALRGDVKRHIVTCWRVNMATIAKL
eukprot:gene30142-biopygen19284